MNIPNLHSNQVMTGVLFFISILPFIVLRLNGSMTASSSPVARKTRRNSRSLVVGLAVCAMLVLPQVMTASAEEVFVMFTDSGPEVYLVDTVQDAGLALNKHNSPSWPMAVPDLRLDKSLFVTLSVNNKPPVLLPGFQTAATSGFGAIPSKIHKQLTWVQGEHGKQVTPPPIHITNSELTQSRQMVHQGNMDPHPSIPN